jgi:cell division protease FtsH
MNSKTKITIALLGAALLCAVIPWTIAGQHRGQSTINYSQFVQQVEAGRVAEVKISGANSGANAAKVRLKDGSTTQTVLPLDYSAALGAMQQQMVNVEIQDASASPLSLAINAVPFLILLALWIFLMMNRQLLGRR